MCDSGVCIGRLGASAIAVPGKGTHGEGKGGTDYDANRECMDPGRLDLS